MPKLSSLLRIVVLFPVIVGSMIPVATPLQASTLTQDAPSGLAIFSQNKDTILEWPSGVTAASAMDVLPKLHYQGYELPMQLVTLRIHDPEANLALQIEQLEASDWSDALTPAAPLVPLALDWTPHPDHNLEEEPTLPDAPVFVLRQGRIHGQMLAVVAISPLYQENGQVKLASHLLVRAAKTTAAPSVAPDLLSASRATAQVQISNAQGSDLAPVNAAAAGNAIKVIVQEPGIQQINGQALAGAGLDLPSADPAKLQLMHNGVPVPMTLAGLGNGRLTPDSELRFYTPEAGDRWNTTSVYWLTVAETDGVRMAVRDVTPAGAPSRPDAFEEGVWEDRRLYVSEVAGTDGDHWFHKKLIYDPANNQAVEIPLENILPPAPGSAALTLTVSTQFKANYHLQVLGRGQMHDITWHSAPDGVRIEDWPHTFSMPSGPTALTLSMPTGDENSGLLVDHLHWRQPATLDFAGKGAWFTGVEGVWTYQLQNTPAGFTLYDVTDPLAPVLLTGATDVAFQDGPAPRRYVLAAPDALQKPVLQTHVPTVFGSTDGAEAIYIAPELFIDALTPLIEHRHSQGYTVKVVDVQDIYDAWSYGHISAEAIRTFLRFAAAHWNPSPISVVLVGDGTWDPHNYENKAHHTNYIPPYLANVDPWLGEAACENCFVQLDGDDPVTGDSAAGTPGSFFKADLWIGRFPVRSPAEVTGLVRKIIRYETDASLGAWRSTAIFLADNYIKGIDETNAPIQDSSGDFAAISDGIIYAPDDDSDGNAVYLGLPPAARVGRVYYDPYPHFADPEGKEPWRIADHEAAKRTALATLNAGAGVVAYNGHSHHWQWARLDTDPAGAGLVNLYDPDALINGDRLFIGLAMTCLTSQFHKPADSGTVLDERTVLNPFGGAIAVWGPAGLSVVHGHDALQRGFYQALWQAPSMQARLGELLEAGYTELLTREAAFQDASQTFLLLGDPLTPARVRPVETVYLPQVSR